MNRLENKRQNIFDKYVSNINLLINHNMISAEYNSYICPLCLKSFPAINDSTNPLTLEDIPPKQLGGKAKILTCKKCNNSCGTNIESHLVNRLKDLDKKKLSFDSKTEIFFELNNKLIKGYFMIDKTGKQSIKVSIKNNNPEIHSILPISKGNQIKPFIKPKTIKNDHLKYALLKTAYLMVFERYGYSIILDKVFDSVREQILNPTTEIYYRNFCFQTILEDNMFGSYIVCNEKTKSLISFFKLSTNKTNRVFGVFLPLPKCNSFQEIDLFIKNIPLQNNEDLILYPNPSHAYKDFLSDISNILDFYSKINHSEGY